MPRRALEPAEYPFFDYRRFTFSLGIVAGDGAWLSGSTAVRHDPGRGMIVDGDLVVQARVVMEKIRLTLAAGGMGMEDVTRLVEYVTPAALPQLPRLAELRRQIWEARLPSVATIAVKSLLRPEALIEIEAVASRDCSDRLVYLPVTASDAGQAWSAAGIALADQGYGRCDVARSTLAVLPEGIAAAAAERANRASTGLIVAMPVMAATDAGAQLELTIAPRGRLLSVAVEGDPAAGDIVGQTREAYRRIEAKLESAGASLNDVVKTTEFITPAALGGYRKTADVRREVFSAPYPAATGVVCERLVDPAAQIAVEAVVVIEGGAA